MKMENKDGEATLWIYDPIGSMFGPDAVTAKGVRDKLANLRGINRLTVRINSPGGEVDDSIAIYTLLREFTGDLVTKNDGVAASAAATIFSAGKVRQVAPGAMTMIHNPWGVAVGDYREMLKAAEVAKAYRDNLATIYSERFSLDSDKAIELMDAETWYTAEEAVKNGVAHNAGAEQAVQAASTEKVAAFAKEVARIAACLMVSEEGTRAHAALATEAIEIGRKIASASRERQIAFARKK